MKKILTSILLTLALPALASASLWYYYADKGQTLPSLEERAVVASQCGINGYTGTYDQNIRLEACLKAQNAP